MSWLAVEQKALLRSFVQFALDKRTQDEVEPLLTDTFWCRVFTQDRYTIEETTISTDPEEHHFFDLQRYKELVTRHAPFSGKANVSYETKRLRCIVDLTGTLPRDRRFEYIMTFEPKFQFEDGLLKLSYIKQKDLFVENRESKP